MGEVLHNHNIGPDSAWTGSRYIDVTDPQPEDFSLGEIATGLSREQRFGGAATSVFWSVAQHSLLAERLAHDDGVGLAIRRVILMHDATEFMLRDMIRPVKRHLSAYTALENLWWAAIAKKFSLPLDFPQEVVLYDNLALAVEKEALVSRKAGAWGGIPDPGGRTMPLDLLALSPKDAFLQFMGRARDLGIGDS